MPRYGIMRREEAKVRLGDAYKIQRNETSYVDLIPRRGQPVLMIPLTEAQRLAHAILAIKPDELPFMCSGCGCILDKEGHCNCKDIA